MEIIPTTLEPYAPAVTTLPPSGRTCKHMGSNFTEQKWNESQESKPWLLVIVCPTYDFIMIFVQNMYFGSKERLRLRDQRIRASIFQSDRFCKKTTKVFATPTARKDHEATPKQCFLQPNEDKWKIKSSSALPSKALTEMMSEPESKQIHRSRIASFTSKYDGEIWDAHNNKW